jgi:hypothetical protein
LLASLRLNASPHSASGATSWESEGMLIETIARRARLAFLTGNPPVLRAGRKQGKGHQVAEPGSPGLDTSGTIHARPSDPKKLGGSHRQVALRRLWFRSGQPRVGCTVQRLLAGRAAGRAKGHGAPRPGPRGPTLDRSEVPSNRHEHNLPAITAPAPAAPNPTPPRPAPPRSGWPRPSP